MKDKEFKQAYSDWDAVFRTWIRNAVKWETATMKQFQQTTRKPKELPDGMEWQLDEHGNKIGIIKKAS
jgi:hypothetical protein